MVYLLNRKLVLSTCTVNDRNRIIIATTKKSITQTHEDMGLVVAFFILNQKKTLYEKIGYTMMLTWVYHSGHSHALIQNQHVRHTILNCFFFLLNTFSKFEQ